MSGEAARGFPAFAAAGRRSTGGQSWWGRSWVQALEDTSLDADQLRKGRRYANSGQVGTITISPGRIATTVQAPEDTYESVVLVDRLSEDEWRRFLDQVGARAGHIAALLDGEMPHDLVDAAADAGVPLLPGIGDLDPSCTCDGWELPCQHAAALCYQVGWLLDDDPFVLLLIRGRSREDLLDELQQRMTSSASESDAEVDPRPGVLAAEVFGAVDPEAARLGVTGSELPDLPGKVQVEDLAVNEAQPLADLAPATLPLLALDAARRARAQLSALLSSSPDPWVLDEWQDAVRLAADYPSLAERLGVAFDRPAELSVGVQAWSYGGAPALEVLEHLWDPDPSELARARTELLSVWDDPELEASFAVEANRLTTADRQLRLDRVGRWHPYELVAGAWVPAGPADRDPAAAFAGQDNW
ncbi:MAG: hypothetical protein QOF10_3340 [Kribbellaceae bacterium]|nr:hypothetical protein [Kribbellaceae bacterium]